MSSFLVNFNSIKVRLEHSSLDETDTYVLHFNSIKVRLERKCFALLSCNQQFQFHKGAIRTVDAEMLCPSVDDISIP